MASSITSNSASSTESSIVSARGGAIGASSGESVVQVSRARLNAVCDNIRPAETAARQASQTATSAAVAFNAEADALASAVGVIEATISGPRPF